MPLPVLDLTLFGSFEARIDGQPVSSFATDKIRALLAYLAVESDRAHRRDTLAGLLWPDYPTEGALRNLRQALYRLRDSLKKVAPALADQLITQTRQTVTLNSTLLLLDSAQFAQSLQVAKSSTHPVSALSQVVHLYRGEFLQGFFISDAYAFDEWLQIQREVFQQQAFDALTYLAALHEAEDAYAAVLAVGQKVLLLDPYHEKTHRQMMRAHLGMGNRSQAVAQFHRLKALLQEELGVAPSSATVALFEQIQVQAAPAVGLPTVPPVVQRHHFPTLPTPLIGRKPDLAYLTQRLQEPSCRLLTITGPGGMGKTRLGVEVARLLSAAVHRFADGIYFVPLAQVEGGDLLVTAVAHSLGLTLPPNAEPRTAVLQHLQTRRLLLLLDNFEHLLRQEPDAELPEAVSFLIEMLAAAPGVALLVTSREPLSVQGEWIYPLEGLPYAASMRAAGEAALELPAPALFIQCAQRYRPSFDAAAHGAAIYEICHLTGGLPLALEIAAAWVRGYAPQEIAQRIAEGLDFLTNPYRDAPVRQRSIRAIFVSTWEQLAQPQQRVLAAMAVFRGGFTVAAAVTVAQAAVLDLAILVEKSLLRRAEERRYDLHELLQQFAAEKLAQSGEETAVRERHAAFYLTFLGEQLAGFNGPAPQETLALVRQSADNIRAAWRWAVENGRVAWLLPAVDAWAQFLVLTGSTREAEEAFADALHHCPPDAVNGRDCLVLRGRLAGHLAWFQIGLGKNQTALENIQAAIALADQCADAPGRGYGLSILGWELQLQSKYDESEAALLEALALFEQTNNPLQASLALVRLGSLYWRKREFAQTLTYYQQSLQIEKRLQNKRGLNRAYGGIGLVYVFMEKHDEALTWLNKALALERELENPLGIVRNLGNMADLYYVLGQYEQALVCYQEAVKIEQETHNKGTLGIWLGGMGNIYAQWGEQETALEYYDRAAELHEASGDRFNLCEVMLGKGEVYLLRGDYEQAEAMIAQGRQLADAVGRQECRFRGELLHVRLLAEMGGQDTAVARLQQLQAEFAGDVYQAQMAGSLWQITGDEVARETAVALYETLWAQTPKALYRQQLHLLRGETNPKTNNE